MPGAAKLTLSWPVAADRAVPMTGAPGTLGLIVMLRVTCVAAE